MVEFLLHLAIGRKRSRHPIEDVFLGNRLAFIAHRLLPSLFVTLHDELFTTQENDDVPIRLKGDAFLEQIADRKEALLLDCMHGHPATQLSGVDGTLTHLDGEVVEIQLASEAKILQSGFCSPVCLSRDVDALVLGDAIGVATLD